ncbi:MAG: DsbE family thiol:disulfide interchange protein [Gammaproteobacteria bacterium]|nr:DsbE family thiol:disulfide interchange protein [Gammaproteobacteria bacterium]
MTEQAPSKPVARYLLAALPLILFMALAFVFLKQLSSGIDPNKLPSVLINLPAPDFPTEPLAGLKVNGQSLPAISKELISGRVVVVNVWASWCVPCRAEHPQLMELAEIKPEVLLIGINYKDKNANALRFLGGLGNPYAAVSIDPNGAASIDWGVYGIPETFILDKTGTIIYKYVGPINEAILAGKLIPILDTALAK